MARVKFNQLPLPTRERMVALLNKGMDPNVARFEGGDRGGMKANLFFAVAGGLTAAFIFQWLFHEDSRKDAWFDREVYYGLTAALWVMFTAIVGIVFYKKFPPPPWPREVRLLTGGYMIYVGDDFVDYARIPNVQPTITNVYRNGAYQGARLTLGSTHPNFTYYCATEKEAEEVLRKLAPLRRAFEATLAERDERGLREIDLLVECTLAGKDQFDEVPDGPKVSAPPGTLRLVRWFGTMALAGIIAYGYFSFMKSKCENTEGCHSRKNYYNRR